MDTLTNASKSIEHISIWEYHIIQTSTFKTKCDCYMDVFNNDVKSIIKVIQDLKANNRKMLCPASLCHKFVKCSDFQNYYFQISDFRFSDFQIFRFSDFWQILLT